jgi:integrase
LTLRKTKNGGERTIDSIPEAIDLIQKIKEKRGTVAPNERVLRVAEGYGAMKSAAEKIGMPRIARHELRDLFSTAAIESGVDIPTVADWLGHLDHGTLLLERYRKHRDEHSEKAAKKVRIKPSAFTENGGSEPSR